MTTTTTATLALALTLPLTPTQTLAPNQARKMAERLAADLEATQEKSDDMFKAIRSLTQPNPTLTLQP
jgi:hypothetical protein